jgi:ubiquinone/menaquinone biosynthesis C-methylase UbiE
MATYDDIVIGGGDTSSPLNMEKRIQFIEPYLNSGNIKLLDCGCGAEGYVPALRRRYQIDAWGIEYLEEKVRQAKRSNPSGDRIQQGDIENLCFPDASFDMILLNEVLEHVPSESKALLEVNRILRLDGFLVVFSPNRWYPFETHGVYLKRSHRVLMPYVPLIPYIPLPIGKHFFDYWARNYWQGELRAMIEQHGFSVERHSFVWQTFENISGTQPLMIRKSKKMFRHLSNLLEKLPFIRRFGVSQVIVAKKMYV